MKNKKKGFTLVELLAVLVVLGIIMIIVAPSAMSAFYKARRSLSEMEQGVVIDAAKIYLTDLDKGKKKYVYQGTTSTTVRGHEYAPGSEMSGYDFRVYMIESVQDGIDVDIKTLVEGGYYDDKCTYSDDGKPNEGCRIQGDCVLRVKLIYDKSPDGAFYVTTGYDAKIVKGCER